MNCKKCQTVFKRDEKLILIFDFLIQKQYYICSNCGETYYLQDLLRKSEQIIISEDGELGEHIKKK